MSKPDRPDEPNNLEAEAWLLGGVLNDPRAMAAIAGLLSPFDFYSHKNQLVWKAMQSLHKEGKPIDIVTLGGELRKTGEFDSLFRENDYLFMLSEGVTSAAHIDWYVELVKEMSQKRQIIAASRKAISNAYDTAMGASDCIQCAIQGLTDIANRNSHAQIEHIADTAAQTLADIARRKKEGRRGGIGSPFQQMDVLTGGFRKGEMTVVGARPGVGKTAFALGIAIAAAKHNGAVLMFSLEMTPEQLSARAMSYHSQVPVKKTMDAALDMVDMQNQGEAVRVLKGLPIYADYEREHTAGQIASIACAFAAKMPTAMIIVDYLQIIKMQTESKSYDNRNIAIGEATRALKVLSGKLNCPVVALSQLNRDTDKFGGKEGPRKPRLSDLRESGNIEQDADVVILLHRLIQPTQSRGIDRTDLIIAKNRSGPTGECGIIFNPQNAMFSEYETYNY